MDARPLRELLADLVGDAGARAAYGADPAGYLAAHGHADLPAPLVSEAVVSYADTAPVEVAAALAPYVAAHGPVPTPETEPVSWFDLLTSAETPADESGEPQETLSDWGELDFGAGADAVPPTPEPSAEPDEVAEQAPVAQDAPEPEWSPETFAPEPPIEGLVEDEPEDEEPLD